MEGFRHFVRYSLLGMFPKLFDELEAKRNIVIHFDQVIHPLLNR